MAKPTKGQNVRVLTYDPTIEKFRCVAKSTSCTLTLNVNTDESSTKDDIGMAKKATGTSQSWQISVETLNVTDLPLMLRTIKAMEPFTLLFDEVSTTDNQTAIGATFARKGEAYMNDLSVNFNDREVASKSIQFQGSGELQKLTSTPQVDVYEPDSDYERGQFTRLFIGSDNTATPAAVLASAKNLTLHVSLSMESATTKDTTGFWEVQVPTELSFDISTSSLLKSGDTITSSVEGKTFADLEDIKDTMQPVRFEIAKVSGANNRTKGAVIVEGSVLVTGLTSNNPNRQDSTWDATLAGYGIYNVPDDPAES